MRKASFLLLILASAIFVPSLSAGICPSTTSCILTLDQGNGGSGFGSGNFGTVDLELAGNTVTVSVSLASGFKLIGTGFPGAVGFADSLGGGLTIGNFSNPNYSGSLSHATNDLHWDGFGFSNDAAATTAPGSGGSTVSALSFTVNKGTSLTDVNQLVNLFNPAGGDGAAVFVVDAFNSNTTGAGAGNTGLIRAIGTAVPEPSSYLALLAAAFGLIVFFHCRKSRSAAN